MKDYQISRFCWLEFNMDNLRDNFLVLKKMVGPDVKIMPAIKVNAYSHGIVACGKVLEECGADYLGVGSIDEGILLRENGVNMPILIFASNLIQETANLYVQYHLIPTILAYGNYSIEDTADFTIYVPKTDEHFATTLAIIPLQLLGYYVSVARGLDVDKPRNLAKSVTVE